MKEKKKLIKSIADLVGGICTTTYANALLTAVCPPAGIAASIGCGLLSGAIGDFGGAKASRMVDSVYALKDAFKDGKKIKLDELESEEDYIQSVEKEN